MTEELTNKLQAVHKGLADHARGCEGRNYSCDCGYDSEVQELCGQAADAIARLTRERDEARSLYAAQTALSQLNHDACEEAETALKQSEAALSAARAELAEWKAKAVVAFQEACTEIKDLRRWANNKGGMFHPEEYVEGIATIRALKEAPHE